MGNACWCHASPNNQSNQVCPPGYHPTTYTPTYYTSQNFKITYATDGSKECSYHMKKSPSTLLGPHSYVIFPVWTRFFRDPISLNSNISRTSHGNRRIMRRRHKYLYFMCNPISRRKSQSYLHTSTLSFMKNNTPSLCSTTQIFT